MSLKDVSLLPLPFDQGTGQLKIQTYLFRKEKQAVEDAIIEGFVFLTFQSPMHLHFSLRPPITVFSICCVIRGCAQHKGTYRRWDGEAWSREARAVEEAVSCQSEL